MFEREGKMAVGIEQGIKQEIRQEAADFIAAENRRYGKALWQPPLIGFADAKSSYIQSLKKIVHPRHQMPEEVLSGASIVIAYYVPFAQWLPDSNDRGLADAKGSGGTCALVPNCSGAENMPAVSAQDLASVEWAQGYELTNAMFDRLNEHLINVVHKLGYEAETASEANIFHRDQVISYWSFRHFAYAAGLGAFGRNNMLITEKGCCGRCNTVVTTLDVVPDQPQREEACLFFRDGRCGACIRKCPAKALTAEGFDRHKCFAQCLKNADVYDSFGSSYGAEGGSEVCGKCLCALPCTHKRP